ncbi:protein lin-54 homolog [Anopheles aquasalis]|uniref:protein lin-54 homolog n=1 Tax=Anopheles aquasalis TaxID=42839 RepID=UPI00215AEACB|nr:protein lin-54 homolog [Anopheles aquasalis]XP_050095193.1 protein lin-54 homolog [Anopheles aquasalis]
MDELKHNIEDSDDLVEYTMEYEEVDELEEHEELILTGDDEYEEHLDEIETIETIEMIGCDGEEYEEQLLEEKDGNSDSDGEVVPSVSANVQGVRKFTLQSSGRSPVTTLDSVVVIRPQPSQVASTGGSAIKLLNNSQTNQRPATQTLSYRLVKSDGSVIMKSNESLKRSIAVSSPSVQPPTKVLLNANARVVQIQSKSGSASPVVPKNVTLAKSSPHITGAGSTTKTITMKSLPGSTMKMVSQVVPCVSGQIPEGSLRVTKANISTQPIATRVLNSHANQASADSPKIILNTANASALAGKKAQLQSVNLSGVKPVQYLRVMKPAQNRTDSAADTAALPTKIVVQTTNKQNTVSAIGQVRSVGSLTTKSPAGAVTIPSKIFLQNNKTYVVRNGEIQATSSTTATPTSSTGKPPLPTQRRIIISGNNLQTQNKINVVGGSRSLVIKTEDMKPIDSKQIRTVLGKSPMLPKAGGSASKETIVKEIVSYEDEEDDFDQKPFTETKILSSIKEDYDESGDIEASAAHSITSMSYSYAEEGYKKRPCNCTKSQCLKLYCDCFANGEFCYNCNCKDCHNTQKDDYARQKAIRCTLERNPNAFKPKIGSIGPSDVATRLHTKGCNCKRSGCLKNYCECYEAKIPCSSNCKCIGCRNTDQFVQEFHYFGVADGSGKSLEDGVAPKLSPGLYGRDMQRHLSQALSTGDTKLMVYDAANANQLSLNTDMSKLPLNKQPHNFMTPDVIEATLQCMIAQADECQKRGCSIRTSERMILQEFGRCLVEIMEFASKSDNDLTARASQPEEI